jgi:membrane protease YdiL (CAAX protease family)
MSTPADEIARLSAEVAAMTGGASAPGGSSGRAGAAVPPAAMAVIWNYRRATKTATYGFFAALPLFILYEVGVLLTSAGPGGIRVGADVWLKSLLAAVGLNGWAALGGVVLVIGALVVWAERRRRPPLRARYLGGILAESLLYGVVLAVIVGTTVGLLFNSWAAPVPMMQAADGFSLPLKLALSIGAGLYEELVFRVLLVGGLFLVLHKLLPGRTGAYVIAALIGAAIFSMVHYLGPYGDPFALPSFTFRFLFGLALNVVFLVRGFAVAAWTHALYDVMVVTGAFG